MKINSFLLGVTLVLAILFTVLVKYSLHQRDEKLRAENNLHASLSTYQTLTGKLATEVQSLTVSTKELRQAASKAEIQRNEYEVKLADAYKTIKDLKKKPGNVEGVNSSDISMKGTDTIKIVQYDTVFQIGSINDGYLKVDFKQVTKQYSVADYSYRDTVSIVIDRERGLAPDGSKRFFRFMFPKWQYYSTVKVQNPKAEINSNTYIRIK